MDKQPPASLRFVLLFAPLLLFASVALSQESATQRSGSVLPKKYDPGRDPDRDLQAALAEAQRTHRRVLLEVGGEWCIWCHRLDDFFQKNKDAAELLERGFVVLRVNYSPENEDFLSRFPEVAGYPHFFVLDSSGALLHSQDTGKLESGDHHDRKKVMAFLKHWAP